MTEDKNDSIKDEAKKELPYLYGSDTPRFYVTGAFGGYTTHDFRLIFFSEMPLSQDIVQTADKLKVIREVQSEIIMSPLAAKELVEWLSRKVDEFEKDFGEISLPKRKKFNKKD